jgi:hypothetical protein
MLISTDAGAGQIVSVYDDTRFYDDVGCLAADWKAHANTMAFVRTRTGEWIDAAGAWFARPDGARTAMSSGFVAYATAEDAKQADRDGRALGWHEVVRTMGDRR